MHRPVLLQEVLDLLLGASSRPSSGIYFDGTIGLGGHAEAILKQDPTAQVVGMDRDETALEQVQKRLSKEMDKRLFLFHGNFKDFKEAQNMFPARKFDGALLDLGFSSFQVDQAERGFSFQKEGPLDMRMDLSQKKTAADLVNGLSERELSDLFFKYGEERHAARIAKAIVMRRAQKPFKTTLELAHLIMARAPSGTNRRIHSATRVFQALRIAVNDEIDGLPEAIEAIFLSLNVGGRLAVISFHSLEDRIVKRSFLRLEHPCDCPAALPECVCGKKPLGRRITRKPVAAGDREILMNPRARSAKLRVIERTA